MLTIDNEINKIKFYFTSFTTQIKTLNKKILFRRLQKNNK